MMLGYKSSDVGMIPEDWEIVSVRQLVEAAILEKPLDGNHGNIHPKSSDYVDYGIPFVMANNFVNGELDLNNCKFIKRERADKLQKGFAVTGDILLTHKGTVGSTAIVGELNTAYIMLTPQVTYYRVKDANQLDNRFLKHYFDNSRFQSLFESLAGGGTRAYLGIVKQLELPIIKPSIDEQRAIAQALSNVDAFLATLDQVIAKKRDLKQAAMQQLLTGKTRLPGFNREWEAKKLGHAGCCLRGVSYRGNDDLSPHDTAFTKRLLRSNNVQNALVMTNDVQFVNDKRVAQIQVLQKNDILICMANGSKALVGKAGQFSINDGFDYTFGAFMGCFRTDESIADPVFVFSLFQTGRYRDYINNLLAGSSINNLSPSSIESLEFSFPPYSEQIAIGQVLAEMDNEIAALEARLDKTSNLKQAMMQELLTGKTRLA